MPSHIVELTTEIVTSHISNNTVPSDQLPSLIKNVYSALASLGNETGAEAESAPEVVGAVTPRRSLSNPDKIISMIDGKPYSSLKRHITKHGYTPDSYRAAFGLKPDYPMVAPGYAALRKELAVNIGLGRKNSRWSKGEGSSEDAGEDQEALAVVAPAVQPEPGVEKKPRQPRRKAREVPEQQSDSPAEQPRDPASEQPAGAE